MIINSKPAWATQRDPVSKISYFEFANRHYRHFSLNTIIRYENIFNSTEENLFKFKKGDKAEIFQLLAKIN
jgi:hypothetical protein